MRTIRNKPVNLDCLEIEDSLSSPAFEIGEYHQRLALVQKAIAAQGLDALVCQTFSNICYLTGFETIGSQYADFALIVRQKGLPILIGSDFEMLNSLISTWPVEYVAYPITGDSVQSIIDVLLEYKLEQKCLGIEPGSMLLAPHKYKQLMESLSSAKLVDATNLIEKVKVVKSPAEIAYIRRAAALSDIGMKAAIDVAAEGKHDNDLAVAAYQAMVEGGSEYMCLDPIVTVGLRSSIPHTTYRRVKIEKGDPILMEFGACIHRYSAPLMRSMVVGPACDTVKKLTDACITCLNTLIENLKPGAISHEVARKAEDSWSSAINGHIWHGFYAYSVGIGFPPKWSDCEFDYDIVLDSNYIIMPGMVYHVAPSLRSIGSFGVAFSETVLVTETGSEVLTKYPRCLIQK